MLRNLTYHTCLIRKGHLIAWVSEYFAELVNFYPYTKEMEDKCKSTPKHGLPGVDRNGLIYHQTFHHLLATLAGVKRLVVSVIMYVCLCVCPHNKTKMAETKITRLSTGIVHHDTSLTS